jgi:hypothetical protein
MEEHTTLLTELDALATAWASYLDGGQLPSDQVTAVCQAYDAYQDRRVNDHREVVTDVKYHRLIEALGQFIDQTGGVGLAEFLAGYLGDDWRAKAARPLDVYQIDFAIEPDPGSGNILSIRGNYEASDPAGAVIAALRDQPDVSNIETDYDGVYFVYRGYALDIQHKDMPDLVEKLQDGRRMG